MRNSTQLDNTDWQQTEEGWQTEFACPVVYLGDKPWISLDCRCQTDFYLNGEYLCTRDKGAGHLSLEGRIRPGRNCLETRGTGGHPEISLLVTPRTHFIVHEGDEPSLSCTCSWVQGSGILRVQAQLASTLPGDTLRLILRDPAGRILDEVEVNADREDPVELVTDKAVLWHGVQDPALLELIGQLRRMGTVKDEIRLFTGLRTYSLDLHGNYLLNGRPYPVKGRILSGEESLQQLAEQGYTAVWDRSGHAHTWLLNACDRLGLVMFSSIGSCHEAQMQTAQGHVCLCFWIQDQDEVPGRDATRLSLDRSLLEIQGQEFSLKNW